MEYVTVAQEGFYGLYHVPVKDHDPKKVVIVVGGSEGNENIPMNVGAMFARCGIAALGICYWNVDGLPKELVRVPVDPFEKAILWLKYGPAIRNLILHQQFELSYIYEEPLKHFDEDTAIHVENIQGNILFIYAKEDLMWPSKEAVAYMVNRLEKHRFAFRVDVLEYEKASHILVPLNPSKLKMFKIERQYPEDCRRSREDAFHKTIKWISEVK